MSAETQESESVESTVILAFKGFDQNLKCRDFQFAIGETFVHEGDVSACNSGFHACENPLDVFAYYPPGESRFCTVELSGQLSRHSDDSKVAAAQIKLVAEISIPEVVTAVVKWIMAKLPSSSPSVSSGSSSPSVSSGYRSPSVSSGDSSPSVSSGYRSPSVSSGDSSPSVSSGDRSPSVSSGDRSPSVSSGYRSPSVSSGDRSPSVSSGDSSPSVSSGDSSDATASGKQSIAIAAGPKSLAKASAGSAIVICYRDDEWNLVHIFSSLVGQNGIKPDVFYSLDADGKPVEEVTQ